MPPSIIHRLTITAIAKVHQLFPCSLDSLTSKLVNFSNGSDSQPVVNYRRSQPELLLTLAYRWLPWTAPTCCSSSQPEVVESWMREFCEIRLQWNSLARMGMRFEDLKYSSMTKLHRIIYRPISVVLLLSFLSCFLGRVWLLVNSSPLVLGRSREISWVLRRSLSCRRLARMLPFSTT